MPRKRIAVKHMQFELFPESKRPNPEEFADYLLRRGIISARHKKKDVKKIVAMAYARIEKQQGIDVKALVTALREAKELNVNLILGKAVKPIRRSTAEKRAIARALAAIVMAAKWKRTANAYRKLHAENTVDFAEKRQQRKHLRDITKQ